MSDPERLAALLARAKQPPATPPAITPRAAGAQPSLSFAQERFWFLNKLEPGNPVYNRPLGVRLTGVLDAVRLQDALNALVARHAVFRGGFPAGDVPRLEILPHLAVPLERIPLPGETPPSRLAAARQAAAAYLQQPIRLEQPPLFRACLFEIAPADHVLFFSMHHILCDGWSAQLFLGELARAYRGEPLPATVDYADYAAWQRGMLAAGQWTRERAYWQAKLAAPIPILELPADRPRPPAPTYAGGDHYFSISPETLDRLRAFSRSENATLFQILLTAFNALLFRLARQRDLLVGCPAAGRSLPETENLLGFLTNTLVHRTQVAAGSTFRALLAQVRRTALEALDHQQLPFEQVLESLRLERSLRHAPLFQVMFNFENVPALQADFPGLAVSPFEIDSGLALFDFSFEIAERAGGLICWLKYSRDLFNDDFAARFASQYCTLLEAARAAPHTPVEHLPLLTPAERAQILQGWNQTATPAPPPPFIYPAFAAQAAAHPTRPALVMGSRTYTYTEVQRRASQFARFLLGQGIQPGARVGVFAPRLPEIYIAMLGIFQAGAVYVPLNPAQPLERLRRMAADAGLALLAAPPERMAEAAEFGVLLYSLADLTNGAHEHFPADPLHIQQHPDQLAYLIYTSGSTGDPKGVMIPQKGIANIGLAVSAAFAIQPEDAVLQFAPISFDAHILDTFEALLNGAALVLAPHDDLINPAALRALVAQHKVTIATLPPAILKMLSAADFPTLRGVISTGEACTPDILADWADGRIFLNGYGPTENTIATTFSQMLPAAQPHIGRAAANGRAYILDDALEPAPLGVPGELYLGGLGLAHGYLNDAALTAARFIPCPFPDYPGERLYRTGDRVRWRADGNIEFLGRVDDQIQIRGQRVEPGEIEAALLAVAGVRAAAVTADQAFGSPALTAWLVLDHPDLTIAAIQSRLRQSLPEYMLPAAFHILDSLPLNTNGKVDRAALRAAEQPLAHARPPDLQTEPRTSAEIILTHIWEAVLAKRPIGIDENFFLLGGHSLTAVQIVAQVREVFGVQLPLARFFESPSIRSLAAAIVDYAIPALPNSLVAIKAGSSPFPFYCIHGVGGHVMRFFALGQAFAPERPFIGVESPGLRDLRLLPATVEALAARYIEDIRQHQPAGPYFLGGHSFGAFIAYEMARQLRQMGEAVPLVVILDARIDQTPLHRRALGLGGYLRYRLRGIRARGEYLLRAYVHNSRAEAMENLRTALGKRNFLRWGEEYGDEVDETAEISAVLEQVYERNNATMKKFRLPRYAGDLLLVKSEEQGRSKYYGWAELVDGVVEKVYVPGKHSQILEAPGVARVAEEIERRIAAALREAD